MFLSEIISAIGSAEADASLRFKANFDLRTEAIEYIEFHIIDRIDGLLQNEKCMHELHLLKKHADRLKNELETINRDLFSQLRKEIRTAENKQLFFHELICKYAGKKMDDGHTYFKLGYDNLDIFINGLLSDKAVPEPIAESKKDMVFYQKTPASIIFKMAEMAGIKPDDVFYDIGSGLGQAVILMNLISGITARGIEYEPAYCQYSEESVSGLNLSNVEFLKADARTIDYSDGTLFFMYTPFEGEMLRDVLNMLKKVSEKSSIRIFTYGKCSFHTAKQNWLYCINGETDNLYKLYEFTSRFQAHD